MRGVVPALLAALLPATTAEVLCYYSTLLGEDELVKVLEGNVVDLTPYGLTDECNLLPDRTSNVAVTVEGFFVTAYGVVALQAKHADGDWSDICVRAGPEEEGSDAGLDDGAPCGAPYVPAGEVGGQWEFRVDGRDYTRLCVDFLCEIGFALQFKVEGDVLLAPSPPPSCEPSRLIGRWVEVANTQDGSSGTYIPVGVEPAEMASDTDWRTAVLGLYNESGFEFGDADGDADDDDDDDSEVRGSYHLEPLTPAIEQAAGIPMSDGSGVYVSGSSRVAWQWTWLVRDTCGAVAQMRTYLLAQTDKPSEHPCCLPELEVTEGEAHGRCKSGPCTCSSDACDGTPHMPPRPPPPPPSPRPPPPRPPRPPSPGLPKWVEPSADSKDEYYAKWRNATIAASVIGGVTALSCVGLFLYCCCCRRRRATPKTNRFTGADVKEGRGSSKASKALGGESSYRPRDVDQSAASERTTPKFKPHGWESKRRSHGSFTAEVDMCEATVSNSAPAVWPPHPQPPGFSV